MLRFFIRIFFPQYQARHHKTVRYAFSVVLFAAIFAGFAAVISGNSSYIKIETDSTMVAQDQKFIIDVVAFAHVPINAVDIVLEYPDEIMVVDGIDVGTSVITLWTEDPYAKNGSIYLRGGTFRRGFVGEHTIARIKAHAATAGDARIIVRDTQLIAGDGLGTEVSADNSSENSLHIVVTGSDGAITATAEVVLVTDMDGDGDVDISDITKFMSAWITKSNTYDFDNDGRMTIKDFSILLAASFFN